MTVRQDLIIRQGETWQFVYTKTSAGSPVNLTGYAARMAIKADINGALEANLSTGADATGGSIALGGSAGTITLSMTATESAELGGSFGTVLAELMGHPHASLAGPVVDFIYDLELVSPAGVVTRELEGRLVLHREVTR